MVKVLEVRALDWGRKVQPISRERETEVAKAGAKIPPATGAKKGARAPGTEVPVVRVSLRL